MKITDFVIVFIILLIPIFLLSHLNATKISNNISQVSEINTVLMNATDDASRKLLTIDQNRTIVADKDAALNAFFDSLYAGFGVLSNTEEQNTLRLYVPAVVAALDGGFYVNYCAEVDKVVQRTWSCLYPYHIKADDFDLYFSLGDRDYIMISTPDGSKIWQGTRNQVLDSIHLANTTAQTNHQPLVWENVDAFIGDVLNYYQLRSSAITTSVEKQLSVYTTAHNRIAKDYGISYQFTYSVGQDSDWNRTIEDVSFFSVFQGYPLKNGKSTFSNILSSRARVGVATDYCCTTSAAGNKYYHIYSSVGRPVCGSTDTVDAVYFTKEECAKAGYFPCTNCMH